MKQKRISSSPQFPGTKGPCVHSREDPNKSIKRHLTDTRTPATRWQQQSINGLQPIFTRWTVSYFRPALHQWGVLSLVDQSPIALTGGCRSTWTRNLQHLTSERSNHSASVPRSCINWEFHHWPMLRKHNAIYHYPECICRPQSVKSHQEFTSADKAIWENQSPNNNSAAKGQKQLPTPGVSDTREAAE